jgi:hypothetical protein
MLYDPLEVATEKSIINADFILCLAPLKPMNVMSLFCNGAKPKVGFATVNENELYRKLFFKGNSIPLKIM